MTLTFDHHSCNCDIKTNAPANLSFTPAAQTTTVLNSKLNWLRAGVLGANDGIVSTAGIVMGVSGAAVDSHALFAAGVAGMVAGALSMAAGEYVSVSTQRDTEKAAVLAQRNFFRRDPYGAQQRLASLIAGRGISKPLAWKMSEELTKKDPVHALTQYEYGIDANDLTNPWHAAWASMISFVLGALIPFIAMIFSPSGWAIGLTVISVSVALAITGAVSAWLGGAPIKQATMRNIVWGNLAMWGTYGIGLLVAFF
ncbi:VIT1/CCC1 transporter family protein [Arcanobacterium phocae]|uniref:Predicted Fe2+/Mn2+ transporter, VIT1/CCC1 family n=1 Tax=Arcanobacterium phocae TaxID=131112 RepID=A0A1H2LIG9_9ACTO|nr:VIT family protein [Arcanobacterium phocae]SDU80642.1 Predicted Fe2+/Mn2+ transporter, VIT1/CCC1 family [Arcanobacterium phocae]